jgi:hypothetical protein
LLIDFPFFAFFERGGVFIGFVYYFVDTSGCFGLYVFYDDFAVPLAFEEGFGVTLLLCFGFGFGGAASSGAEEVVQFVVQAFGGVYSAFGGVLHLGIIFEGVGVYHVGGFDVDVPRFFFEASAYFDKGFYGVEQVEVSLELCGVEPVGEVLGELA